MTRPVWFATAVLVALGGGDPPGIHQGARGDVPLSIASVAVENQRISAPGHTAWIENLGQWPAWVRLVARRSGAWVVAERDALSLYLDGGGGDPSKPVPLRFRFEGCSPEADPAGGSAQVGRYHFFHGNDASRWVRDARTFSELRWRDLYPGIDLLVRAEDRGIKYDLVVAPSADLSHFAVRCEGIAALDVSENGSLRLLTSTGTLEHLLGRTWEELPSGEESPVPVRHRRMAEDVFGLSVERRDVTATLVIDPSLLWSTYLGSPSFASTGDVAYAAATDRDGDVTVVGYADWINFPTTPGTYQHPNAPGYAGDTFVTRFRGNDGALMFSSIIGGFHNQEKAVAVAVDDRARPTVAGWTFSPDFPVTPGAFDTAKDTINDSGFVLRLSSSGNDLEYSTFLEGSQTFDATRPFGVALDPLTSAPIVVGFATSGFPTTPHAFDPTWNGNADGFVTRIHPDGSSLDWSTYFGGWAADEIWALAVDETGDVAITGRTSSPDLPTTPGAFDGQHNHGNNWKAFVAKLDPRGQRLRWSTYLGGSGSIPGSDYGQCIKFEPSRGVVVAGSTGSSNFPTTPGAFQTQASGGGFITRFSRSGQLLRSTLLYGGGSYGDPIYGLAVDSSAMPTVVGATVQTFPTTPGAFDTTWNGNVDLFVSRFDPSLSKLVYSTFLGGPGFEYPTGISMSATRRVSMVGASVGGYPTTPGSFSPTYSGGQTDAIVTTFDLLLEGIEQYGRSTPSCRGPLDLNALSMPAAGSSGFGLYCSGAPPLASGWLLLGTARAQPLVKAGVSFWLDPDQPINRVPIQSDADGYVEIPLPLPPGTTGRTISGQCLFKNTIGCGVLGTLCGSQALTITVQ